MKMGLKYIHLNYILRYLREIEKVEFKIVDSKNYKNRYISGHTEQEGISSNFTFKVIIPNSFQVSEINLIDSKDFGFTFEVLNSKGENALEGPNAVIWNSELHNAKVMGKIEEQMYISSEAIENGVLFFENFKNVPEIVSFKDIEKYM